MPWRVEGDVKVYDGQRLVCECGRPMEAALIVGAVNDYLGHRAEVDRLKDMLREREAQINTIRKMLDAASLGWA